MGSRSWENSQPAVWVSLQSPAFPLLLPRNHVQVLEPEMPPSPPVPEVTTPEPGVYHGICECPLLGQGREREGRAMATWDGVSGDTWTAGTLHRGCGTSRGQTQPELGSLALARQSPLEDAWPPSCPPEAGGNLCSSRTDVLCVHCSPDPGGCRQSPEAGEQGDRGATRD